MKRHMTLSVVIMFARSDNGKAEILTPVRHILDARVDAALRSPDCERGRNRSAGAQNRALGGWRPGRDRSVNVGAGAGRFPSPGGSPL